MCSRTRAPWCAIRCSATRRWWRAVERCRDMPERYALITGASGGIGAAVAETLAGRGLNIVLNCRRADERSDAVRRAVETHDRAAIVCPFDVTDRTAVQTALRALVQEGLEIDVVVNNAGIARNALLLEQSADDWTSTVSTTL